MSDLRICVDARLTGGDAGGVAQFVIGLAHGLAQLSDGEEEYLFLAYPDAHAWLKPYLGANSQLLYTSASSQPAAWKSQITRFAPFLRKAWHRLSTQRFRLPTSDGTIERAGMEVMHFTFQSAFLTQVPSIYHPHDLQHLHLPEFFTPRVRRFREFAYRGFCDQAQLVAVASSWGKRDLLQQYGLPDEKVQVIPLAPSIAAYPLPTDSDLGDVRTKFDLPNAFVFYPAQTWPHKNHVGLLRALAILRDEYQLIIPLVSSGYPDKDFHAQVERQVRQLGLEDQVRFLGFVSPLELQALYRLCRCVVIPTRFEAGSFPLWEAFLAGAPAACSNVTSLPEQAGDAALIFDPEDSGAMASAIERLWFGDALCQTLVERGRRRVAQYSWERTARLFRAHYRRLANAPQTEEDKALLTAPSPL